MKGNDKTRPLIAITMGDPAGVGPELCLRALSDPGLRDCCIPVVFGSGAVLGRVAAACGLEPPAGVVPLAAWDGRGAGAQVVDCGGPDAAAVVPGRVDGACGRAAYAYVEAAARAAMAGQVAAIATAPINKEALRLGGVPYPGHTEMLADLTGERGGTA